MAEPSAREELLARIARETFDIVVIGGGITGAGIAHDAALRGLTVALLEQGDFASGTSGQSSRLIHGGLRYLRHGKLRLVRESLQERHHLLRLAPHLVRRIPFVLPHFEGAHNSPLLLRVGLIGYGLLAGTRRIGGHRTISKEALSQEEPQLRRQGLRGGLGYYDAATDDARLTLAVIRSALRRGAAALNYLEAVGFERTGARVSGVHYRDAFSGAEGTVRARVVVSAAGPWTERVRQLAQKDTRMRPTKGIHIVVPRDRLATNAVVTFGAGDRMLFAVPHGRHTYIGTTDTDYADDPSAVRADRDDVVQVLEAANNAFDVKLTESDIVATWAGVRPLLDDEGTPSEVGRDYVILDGPPGLVTITGGKLTTFRAMAEHLLDHVIEHEEDVLAGTPGRCRTLRVPLAGAENDDFESFRSAAVASLQADIGLDDEVARRLVHLYGTEYQAVLAKAEGREELLQPLEGGCPVLAVEAAYAAECEMAMTLEDFMRRRTSLMLFGGGEGAAERAAQEMARVLGWGPEETQAQLASYRGQVARMFAFRGDGDDPIAPGETARPRAPSP